MTTSIIIQVMISEGLLLSVFSISPENKLYWQKAFGPEYLSNWGLVIAALLTLIFVCWQAYETRRAAQIGNRTLVSSLRPRLIIRRASLCAGDNTSVVGVPDAFPWKVDYVIANKGQSRAQVVACSFTIAIFKNDDLPATPPYGKQTEDLGFFLQAGEEREFSVKLESDLVTLFRLGGVKGGYLNHQNTAFVYLLGYVHYKDDLGTLRKMAILRHYDTKSGRFKKLYDPDYEYSD